MACGRQRRSVVTLVLLIAATVIAHPLGAEPPSAFPEAERAASPAVNGVVSFPPPSAEDDKKQDKLDALLNANPEWRKEIEAVIENHIKRHEAAKALAEEEKKKAAEEKQRLEALQKQTQDISPQGCFDPHLNLPILYDVLHPFPEPGAKPTKWYDRMSIRGYTQIRFDRTLETDPGSATPNLFGDRGINGSAENFTIRRLRLIFFGDMSDYMSFYIQPDFGSTPQGSAAATAFGQLRDAYADVYLEKDRVNRFRIGLSKVPYGWENMQSSQNRIPLDRTDALNTAVAPNERDLGVFYYWTPEDKQKLFKALVDGGLKGSGNYGIFGLGAYNGQGGSVFEANLNLHTVARVTWPMQLDWANGQVIEGSVQGYRGYYVVTGAAISPLGVGPAVVPEGTGGRTGILEQRVAGTFVFYPQPFGFQAEWQVGEGPGLNNEQTAVVDRSLYGGYVMAMYRQQTDGYGIFTPYCRYQQYKGGYRNIANAPYGNQRQLDLGLEWQIRKEMELVFEYSLVNVPNFTAQSAAGAVSYRDFEGTTFRVQFQMNY
jgi:hypothetical protein